MTTTFEWHHEVLDHHGDHLDERTLEIDCYVTAVVPGKTWGPPETCYPDEGGDCELEDIRAQDGTKIDWEEREVEKNKWAYVVTWGDGVEAVLDPVLLEEHAWDQFYSDCNDAIIDRYGY